MTAPQVTPDQMAPKTARWTSMNGTAPSHSNSDSLLACRGDRDACFMTTTPTWRVSFGRRGDRHRSAPQCKSLVIVAAGRSGPLRDELVAGAAVRHEVHRRVW